MVGGWGERLVEHCTFQNRNPVRVFLYHYISDVTIFINLNNTHKKQRCDSIALPRVQRQVDHTVELQEIKYI